MDRPFQHVEHEEKPIEELSEVSILRSFERHEVCCEADPPSLLLVHKAPHRRGLLEADLLLRQLDFSTLLWAEVGVDLTKPLLKPRDAHISEQRQDWFEPKLAEHSDKRRPPKDDILMVGELEGQGFLSCARELREYCISAAAEATGHLVVETDKLTFWRSA
jgi:hypothetical protein